MSVNSIGIASVATNKYLDFYFDLVKSFKDNCLQFSEITFYLFTDRSMEANTRAKENSFSNIVVIEIPSLGWPDASLMRYNIFYENREIFDTDILVYLDSDMLVIQNPVAQFVLADQIMTFIRHPGYYYEFSMRFFRYTLKNPKKVASLFL